MVKMNSFEERMKCIEDLCNKMNQDAQLDEMMSLYEKAVEQIAECKKMLDDYSAKLEEITAKGTVPLIDSGTLTADDE